MREQRLLRRAGVLAALLTLGAAGPPPCPVDRASHLMGDTASRAKRIEAAMRHPSRACRSKAELLADYLDLAPGSSCPRALLPPEATPDADRLALGAGLAWRCGQTRRAHRDAIGALRLDSEAVAAWIVLGNILESRFRFDAARGAYERALAVNPESAAAYLGLAGVVGERELRRSNLSRYLELASSQAEPFERIRGARDNLALIDALAGRPVWVIERLELPGEISLLPLSSRPGRLRGWLIRCQIGDQKGVPALLDSGASGLHLAPKTARRSGLEALTGGLLFGGGGSGRHEVVRGLVDLLDLGPIRFRQALGVQAPSSLQPQGLYRSIIGFDVFAAAGLRVRIEPRRSRMILEEGEPYEPASRNPLEVDPWPKEGQALLRVQGQWLLEATISSSGRERRGLFLLDTGASRTMIAAEAAETLTAFRRGSGRRAAAYGGALAYRGSLPRLRIEAGTLGATLKSVPVIDLSARSRMTGIRVSGYLGLDLLARQSFDLDLARGVLLAAPSSPHRE